MYICPSNKAKQNNKIMQNYIDKIIANGLKNGATLEQMLANPEAAALAYLNSQLKALDAIDPNEVKRFITA